ncbi:SDR family oxidoreductase [Pontiella agarivorans]|uniref:SDR family oxidoreductase n=1 Tax=Pontiella agarivorans TaxID=3038953 RepID=A0ABU5N159_9BACT|nr:SDR family oxidoreductase [Pontiella agarivorans]MDZ8120091.1 SDR family oxidoreductase [Pontiella agarivorans]
MLMFIMNLSGKRALVTGGAVRIGKAIVQALQAEGVDVVVHFFGSKQEAEMLSPFTVRADLGNLDEVSGLIEAAGPLDILINNASLFTKDTLAEAQPERALREMNVNLLAPMELTRCFAKQTTRGAVINLLDRRIRANDPAALPYSLSKKGLEELTKLTALELAPGIRVNGVAPGPILPPPGESVEHFADRAGNIPLQLFPTPENIAEAVIFLLKADFCTGQVMFVDGGQHLLGNGVFDQGV